MGTYIEGKPKSRTTDHKALFSERKSGLNRFFQPKPFFQPVKTIRLKPDCNVKRLQTIEHNGIYMRPFHAVYVGSEPLLLVAYCFYEVA